MSVDTTLDGRQDRYGPYAGHALIAQALKDVMHGSRGWDRLSPSQREALDMIQHKVARVLNGDPNYGDNWHDIAGYARLVERELEAAP